MLILALDTSGKSLSAALVRDGELLGETILAIGLRHSATALPLVHDLCTRCGADYPDIDAYACAIGPGSYTGIRIGVSLIKGMAYAAGRPAVGISSLDALAAGLGPAGDAFVVPLVDARSGRIFCSALRSGSAILPEGNRLQTQLAAQLEPHLMATTADRRRLILVGDGSTAFADPLLWPGAASVTDAGMAFRWPRAAVIAHLAAARLAAGGDFSAFALDASYVSPSQAERLHSPDAAGERLRLPDAAAERLHSPDAQAGRTPEDRG